MQLSHLLMLAGVLGANAHPSGHAHLHRHAHEKRVGSKATFYKAEKPHIEIPVESPTVTAQSAVATPTGEVAPPAKSSESASPPSSDDEYIPFCGQNGATKKAKRVTIQQIHYKGNTGLESGCPWNSNMILIPNGIADKYDYVQTYTNVAKVDYDVRCFNKIGPDNGLTGMFSVNMDKQLKFTLAPGETKTLAFETNTQGVCAFAPKKIPLTSFGQLAGNWVEFDWENVSNNGWSGADCSSLVAQHYDMDVPGCSVCEGSTCSIIHPGGVGENAYTKGMEALDGIGLNIKPGPATMTIKVGIN